MNDRLEIRIEPPGLRILSEIKENFTLFDVLKDYLGTFGNCGGTGKCGKCKIQVLRGEHLFCSPSATELQLLGSEELKSGYRLACCCRFESQRLSGQSEVLKIRLTNFPLPRTFPTETISGRISEIVAGISKFTPPFKTLEFFLRDMEPSLVEGVLKRIQSGVRKRPNIHLTEIQALSTLKRRRRKISCIHFADTNTVSVLQKRKSLLLTFGVDIGTTNMDAVLFDIKSRKTLASASVLNPQAIYGDDVFSRITFCLKSKKNGEAISRALWHGIQELFHECCKIAGVKGTDIIESIFIGNSPMIHFLLNISPYTLAYHPYMPVFRGGFYLKIHELPFDLKMNKSGRVYVPPLIGGFIGSDNISVQIAFEYHLKSKNGPVLILDVGTNTEIVVIDREKRLACSCASGPAFEGMHITHGMRAEHGAISGGRIDPETFELTLDVIGKEKPRGICGSGIVSLISEAIKCGIIGSNGLINKDIAQKTNRIREGKHGLEIVIATKNETASGEDLVLTQQDILEIQKAKAAIRTGWSLLLRKIGKKETELAEVVLTGAFGEHLKKRDACKIGLLPDLPVEIIKLFPYASLTGICIMALSREARKRADVISKNTQHYEIASEKNFSYEYAKSMLF